MKIPYQVPQWKTLLSLIALIFSHSLWAAPSEHFQRYELIEFNGQVTHIRDKGLDARNIAAAYFQALSNGQTLLASDPEANQQKNKVLSQMQNLPGWKNWLKNQHRKKMRNRVGQALEKIDTVSLGALFQSHEFQNAFTQFEGPFQQILLEFDFAVLAYLNNPTHFFARDAFLRAVEEAANLAVSAAGAPAIVSHLLVRTGEMAIEMHDFRQATLLYYLEAYSGEELGLTESERRRALSSIYEGNQLFRSLFTWENYGENKLLEDNQQATERFAEGDSGTYTPFGLNKFRLMSANTNSGKLKNLFEPGDSGIVNGLHARSLLDSNPAPVINYASPDAVLKERIFLELLKAGLSMAPSISTPLIDLDVQSAVDSLYIEQKALEGILKGYFEDIGDEASKELILRQSVNVWTYALISEYQ